MKGRAHLRGSIHCREAEGQQDAANENGGLHCGCVDDRAVQVTTLRRQEGTTSAHDASAS